MSSDTSEGADHDEPSTYLVSCKFLKLNLNLCYCLSKVTVYCSCFVHIVDRPGKYSGDIRGRRPAGMHRTAGQLFAADRIRLLRSLQPENAQSGWPRSAVRCSL